MHLTLSSCIFYDGTRVQEVEKLLYAIIVTNGRKPNGLRERERERGKSLCENRGGTGNFRRVLSINIVMRQPGVRERTITPVTAILPYHSYII